MTRLTRGLHERLVTRRLERDLAALESHLSAERTGGGSKSCRAESIVALGEEFAIRLQRRAPR